MSAADLLPLPPGLVAVTGDEGSGKTTLLRRLGEQPSALWLDLALPGQDDQTLPRVWAALQPRCPQWDASLQQRLVDALGLQPHLGKQLFMLSTGSRRKVAMVGLLAGLVVRHHPGAAGVVRQFLHDAADHASRTWVVADYEADARLPWRRTIALDKA
ncbi:MAG: hypothetical protein EOO25_16290 [Comamonadaceae bacterium]|nr:MAG: hypothetical protein EOO25_16290 [Comamonadaceae bacterium]